ncbi:MAG TPA: TIR domain-containing protein [Allosphingosinicella sp.]|nr:TIR domain-containing protein [Allosphingosinicella sp.]
MPDIFLSYNREDQAVARRFAEAFEAEGFSVWWDVTLRSGEAYDEVTEAALRSAGAVVVLWSKKSVASRWVRAEATMAHRNKTLLPAMIEPCERPIMFELTQTAELSHWKGDPADRAWRAFVADARRLAAIRSGAAAPAAPQPASKGGRIPVLAVLPLVSRSGIDEDEILAEDLSDELIAVLPRNGYFRVIASGTAAAYGGKTVDIRVIARELRASYVAEGNLRRVGSNLRLMIQLVEGRTSSVLWSSKYVWPAEGGAESQDDLVNAIASDIALQVLRIELERAMKKSSGLTAWERALRSMASFNRMGPDNVRGGIEEARAAVALAPDLGLAHGLLAAGLATDLFLSASEDQELEGETRAALKRALALDGDNPHILSMASAAHRCLGDPQTALLYAQRATQLTPNIAYAHYTLGGAYLGLGRASEALAEFDIEERLAAQGPLRYASLTMRALAHLMEGQVEAAAAALDRSLQLNPDFLITLRWKAIVAAMQGQPDEARAAVRRMRDIEPSFTLEQHEAQNLRLVPDAALAANGNELLRESWGEGLDEGSAE